MNKATNISPLIKTAAVTIALMTSITPSTSQAADFLGRIVTQGLSEDLIFDRGARLEGVLALIERGICADDEIDDLIKEYETKKKELVEKKIPDLEKKIPGLKQAKEYHEKRHADLLVTLDRIKPADYDTLVGNSSKELEAATKAYADAEAKLAEYKRYVENYTKEIEELKKLKNSTISLCAKENNQFE